MSARIKGVLLAALLVAAAFAQSGVDASQAREIFSEIGGILRDLHDITGFKIKHQVPAEIITRDKVKEFLQKRLKEASSPEDIRVEELTLKKFAGFRPGQEHRRFAHRTGGRLLRLPSQAHVHHRLDPFGDP